jgi:FlaA1/EpsC-like NDP-sugar epimerase
MVPVAYISSASATPGHRVARVLVTGAAGSLGLRLVPALEGEGHDVFATDKDDLDVTSNVAVSTAMRVHQPDLVYHLAAEKFAPDGEDDPELTMRVNAVGTANVLNFATLLGAKVVTASTCKACNPETVYGASKLIAERLTLNAGGWVTRFYNVRETCGNVFETWARLNPEAPIPVAPCSRYFISADQATDLLLAVTDLEPGRYTVSPGAPVRMTTVARVEYPGRPIVPILPRRGDRKVEPRCAACEKLERTPLPGVERIVSAHDDAATPAAAAVLAAA